MIVKTRCNDLAVPQLKQMCKENKIRGFTKMKKAELVTQCCEAFSSELGASPRELKLGEEKEIANKIENVNVFRDVLKKKMIIAKSWLDNFKKATGSNFTFGNLDSRKVEFDHEAVYRDTSDRYGFGTRKTVDYYKSTVTTNPLSVMGRHGDNSGYLFFLTGENIAACRHNWSNNMPCISETGSKFFIDKEDQTASKMISRKIKKLKPPEGGWGEYEKNELKRHSITCVKSPELCGSIDKISLLDNIMKSLDNANNGMDEMKNVIVMEKKRIAEAERVASQRKSRAVESLKGWESL